MSMRSDGMLTRTGRAIVAVLLACLAGCAAMQLAPSPAPGSERWAREVRRRGVDPASVTNPLRYTGEMQVAARSVTGAGTPIERLRRLQRYLFDEESFPFDYDSRRTYTAVEAFDLRTGNCVSFTNLFIALARSVDIKVRAGLLIRPGDVEQEGRLIVVHNHIVAVHEHTGGATVFDFNRYRERSGIRLSLIDNAEMTAVYLNNRGAETLLEGDTRTALDYLETAVRLAPDFAQAFGNLGVVRRQAGDVAGALDAYRTALEIDPGHPTILSNLAALHRSMGHEREARAAVAAADMTGATPQFLLIRGDLELVEGRPGRALRYYRRAARGGKGLAAPRVSIARAELALGRTEAARKALRKALELDPGHTEARALLESLE